MVKEENIIRVRTSQIENRTYRINSPLHGGQTNNFDENEILESLTGMVRDYFPNDIEIDCTKANLLSDVAKEKIKLIEDAYQSCVFGGM
ncbi:hypothetical protein GOV13_02445 [Candidatus Pacearchaeota archaeon]|nr:hypothetical protein [Candidatus Pacearchaeota archaeon]